MRKTILFIPLVLVGICSAAQSSYIQIIPTGVYNGNAKQQKKKIVLLPDSSNRPLKNVAKNMALYSHSVQNADVYILPKDNMPCLKADSSVYRNDMPNVGIVKGFSVFVDKQKKAMLGNPIPNANNGEAMEFEKKPTQQDESNEKE